jgi:type 1 fimbriae regulatory protein FimB/type 1 fimbriae regulatory protein FimE
VLTREYLTPAEVEALIHAANRVGRHRHRDAVLLLIAYRHGLRVTELVSLRWDQVDFIERVLRVTRLKNGTPSNHPIGEVETRALRRLRHDYIPSPYVFVSELKGRMTTATVRKMIARAGQLAGIPFPVHPHMLRHACGYKLANDGRDTRAIQHYLGHKNIENTVKYTELAPDRFDGFWSDTEPIFNWLSEAPSSEDRLECVGARTLRVIDGGLTTSRNAGAPRAESKI